MDNLAASVLNRLETVKDAGLAGTCARRRRSNARTGMRIRSPGWPPGVGNRGGGNGEGERTVFRRGGQVVGHPPYGVLPSPPRDL